MTHERCGTSVPVVSTKFRAEISVLCQKTRVYVSEKKLCSNRRSKLLKQATKGSNQREINAQAVYVSQFRRSKQLKDPISEKSMHN